MITITLERHENNHKITLDGHAGYAEHGKDIVCASVSTLLQVFCESVEQLTTDTIKTSIKSGNALIEYGNLTAFGNVLLDSFLLGLGMIAEAYPDHVKIVRALMT